IIFIPTYVEDSSSIKKTSNRERRTLDPQVVCTLPSRSAAQRPRNIRSAISILEAQPFSGRRVDVVRIVRVRDRRWPGHRKQTKPRRRSEAQAGYETFLRYRVVFPGRVTVHPTLEIPSVDRRAFGEYLQPASNPVPCRPPCRPP